MGYYKTFAHVARPTSVRTLIAIAAVRGWGLFQIDVKNVFLNVDLQEEVYTTLPVGYVHPPHKGCRLRHALYGLKQAPRAWFAKFNSTISQLGFSFSSYNSALFIRKSNQGTVDDMIIMSDDLDGIHKLKTFLNL